jgi:hypothetical protein
MASHPRRLKLISNFFDGKYNLKSILIGSSTPEASYTCKNKKFWEELIAYFPLIQHGPHRK